MPPIRRCTALLLYALRDAHLIFLECDFPDTLCRVEDFWVGYKLFCYAFYSNSVQHEGEFQQSKLGLWFFPSSMFQCTLSFIPPPNLPCHLVSVIFRNALAICMCGQDNLFGDATLIRLHPRAECFAQHAHRCFLWSRCIVGGNYRRIVATCMNSCSDSTPRLSCRPMHWVARCWPCSGMKTTTWRGYHAALCLTQRRTHSMPSETGSQPWTQRFAICMHRCRGLI